MRPQTSDEKAGPTSLAPQRVRRRRPPSPSEQARRVAWGHKYGPMVGQMIRASIARTER